MKRLFSMLLFALLWTPIAVRAAPEQPELILYDIPDETCVSLYSAAPAAQLEPGIFDPDRPGYGSQLTTPVAVAAYEALAEQYTPDNTRISIDLSFMAEANWATEVYPSMLAALSAYVFDHPESQFCSIRQYGRLENTAVYLFSLPDSEKFPEEHELARQDMARRYGALQTAAADYAACFDTTLPPAEQYRRIHDDICSMAVYNYDAAAAGVVSQAHTAYGLLVDGDAVVCEGYAKAFKVLCDAVGLPCMLIAGESVQSGQFTGISNHMWNAVCLDGKWYSVDLTWNDLAPTPADLPTGMEFEVAQYRYFLDNAPFLDGNAAQDHRPSGNIYFQHSWPMTFALPPLAEGRFEHSPYAAVTLTLLPGEHPLPASPLLFAADFKDSRLAAVSLLAAQPGTAPSVTLFLPPPRGEYRLFLLHSLTCAPLILPFAP